MIGGATRNTLVPQNVYVGLKPNKAETTERSTGNPILGNDDHAIVRARSHTTLLFFIYTKECLRPHHLAEIIWVIKALGGMRSIKC